MRIIAVSTLKVAAKKYPLAEQAIFSWNEETENANWSHPNELKEQYKNASIISSKRVVFNIHGNSFRLIVDVEYRLKIIFIVWFGTHKEYDKINAKTISYVKDN